jgi:hypothetical protein
MTGPLSDAVAKRGTAFPSWVEREHVSVFTLVLASIQILSVPTGGGGRIRTHESLAALLVFKTSAFNHSATPPAGPHFDDPRRICPRARQVVGREFALLNCHRYRSEASASAQQLGVS